MSESVMDFSTCPESEESHRLNKVYLEGICMCLSLCRRVAWAAELCANCSLHA